MRNFTLAFPLALSKVDAVPFLSEQCGLPPFDENTVSWVIPGCSLMLKPSLQERFEGLERVFDEHFSLESEEKKVIQTHQSLFFLQGKIQTVTDFQSLNCVILSFFEKGILGVYMEHSGTALLPAMYRELMEDCPLEAWLNFIQNADYLYTLGMEALGLSDFRVSLQNQDIENARQALLSIAESVFMEKLKIDTGFRIKISEEQEFEFRKTPESLYRKEDYEYNRYGVWNLIPLCV